MKNKICSFSRLALLVVGLNLSAPAAHAATPPLAAVVALTGQATVTNECHSPYTDLGAFSGASALAGGAFHSLALRSDGTVAAWGDNGSGQTNIPAGLSNVVALAAGGYHSLALRSDGTVAAWGNSDYGQTNLPAGLSNVVALAAGYYHSLALRSNGTVAAWGYNDYGQTNIPAGLSNVVALAGGYYHSLALRSDGTVVAWGDNSQGQTNTAGLSNVVALAGGWLHSLALRSDGTVAAWGYNNYGQTNIPAGLNNVVALAAGLYHSLALRSDGTVAAWGYNGNGQTNIPAGLSNVVALAGGTYHSLALRSDGTVAAWGDNSGGQTNIPAGISLPVAVSGSVGTNTPGSYVLTYRATNYLGVSGSVTRTVVVRDTLPPVITLLGSSRLTNLLNTPFIDPGATALDACGGSFAILTNSTLNVTQLGTYTVSYRSTDSSGNSATNTRTVVVVPIAPAVNTLLASGTTATTATLNGTVHPGGGVTTVYFQYGLTTSYGSTSTTNTLDATNAVLNVTNLLSGLAPGTIYHYQMVAANSAGTTLGSDLTFSSLLAPAAVLTLNGQTTVTNECHSPYTDLGAFSGASALAGGGYHNLALRRDGTVVAWGYNNYGQTNIPAGLSNVVALASGQMHSLALRSDGTVAAWGDNSSGQTNIPAGLSNVVALAGGYRHSLALRSDGTVAAWGRNTYGQTNTAGLSNVVALAGGWLHSLALRSDGTVAAWGTNGYGQTTIPAGLSNVVALAAGANHSLALRSNGTVAAWGNNDWGQTTIPAGLSNVVALAGGGFHSLALRSDGTVAAWGNNGQGQTSIPAGLSNVIALAAGEYNNLALRSDGTLAAWGNNDYGQTTIPAGISLPVAISGSVDTNAPGSYVLTYRATNYLGVSGSVTRTVVVRDTLPPVITLLGSSRLTNLLNAPFIDLGATALDACGGSFAITTNNLVNVTQLGTYTVSYRSTDSSGNSATNTRTVVVVNNQPVIFSVTGSSISSDGAFKFSFTNLTGLGFTVLGSTNVALPMAQWTVLGATVENPPGQYQFTDPQATNNATRFYRVRSP